jgi:hypothetical protein
VENEQDLRLGFWFAIKVAQTAAGTLDMPRVVEVLRAVASGDLSLIPSPEEVRGDSPEALALFERHFGRQPNADELQQLDQLAKRAIVRDRQEQDARNKDLAKRILGSMDEPTG